MKKSFIHMNTKYLFIMTIIIYSFLSSIECKRAKLKQFALQQKETNAPNFIRLVVMRLIFGIAASMGYGDRLAGFLGGIFVPPGAEDYDDYGDVFDDYGSDIF
ncbi:uncharacterized protein [Chelonus insularis]|uniref:uncharacterized protein n=1 Tax=Chelonus insularis TaxID=460826 RepID=UPI00158E6548|nr:uncharacterized protein LOC118065662 [Chelonus insularis]